MRFVAFCFQACVVLNSTTMLCVTPTIEAPESFTRAPDYGVLNNFSKSESKSESWKRRRSAPEVQAERNLASKKRRSAPTVEPVRSLELYVGFSLDGVRDYQDLSDTKDMIDYSRITYYTTPPTVLHPDSYDIFVPHSGAKIRIQVAIQKYACNECIH
jgi:hypothetical protein